MKNTTTKFRTDALKRSAIAMAVGICLATQVHAQSAVGSIYGTAESNAKVTIQDTGTGFTRSVTADSQGRYSLDQLQPGDYKVTSSDVTRTTHVYVGTGANVDFATKKASKSGELGNVVVTGGKAKIDVSSVENATVFTAKELLKLPVQREISSVAMLAPGVVAGPEAYGKLVSIGGGSVAENGYYINGFDITNPRSFMSYFDIPYEAVGEAQIKTGGYGAEYGRSLGGVLSQNVKRGTNEWHYGTAVYYTPNFLHEKQIINKSFRELDFNNGRVQTGNKDDSVDYLKYNVYASGPIIKDKLFFFALYQGKGDVVKSYGNTSASTYRDKTPQELVKLDWNITNNHHLELLAVNAKININTGAYRRDLDANGNPVNPYTKKNLTFVDSNDFTGGGKMGVLRYTGWFGDNFTLSAQAGRLDYTNGNYRKEPTYVKCPYVVDTGLGGTAQYKEIGCAVNDPVYGPWYKPVGTVEKDIRTAYRIDGGWHFGDHEIKFGWDGEKISSNSIQPNFDGGAWYNYFTPDANGQMIDYMYSYGTFGGLGKYGNNLVQKLMDDEGAGTFRSKNTAIYLDDNWHVTKNLLLYGGIRKETFDNHDQHGHMFIRANAQWSPRLGFSWDVKGDSSFKLYGTLGRYYIPAPGILAITNARYNFYTTSFHTYSGRDPATNAPTGLSGPLGFDVIDVGGSSWNDGPANGITAWNFSTNPPQDPRTVVSQTLKPMGQDELILGAQWAVGNNWTFGMKATKRTVFNGVDNYCYGSGYGPLVQWMNANGYPNYTAADATSRGQARCIFVNPGVDPVVPVKLGATLDSPLVNATLPNSTLGMGTGLQHYKRHYQSMEFTLEKQTNWWYVNASYLWSRSYGNVEGYANSSYNNAMGNSVGTTNKYSGGGATIGQGINFNHPIVDIGSYGDLPSSRTHTAKIYGFVKPWGDQFEFGGNLILQSGRKLSCLGASPYSTDDLRNGYSYTDAAYNAANSSDLAAMKSYSTGVSTHFCHDKPYNTTYTDANGYTYAYTSFAPSLHPAGTAGHTPMYWNFDFSFAYIPDWAHKRLTFRMNVFNLFNHHGAIGNNEYHDTRLAPSDAAAAGFTQTVKRSDGSVVVPGAVGNTAADKAALATYGGHTVMGPNPNYLNQPSYQSPRYVEFSVRYEF